MTPTNHSRRFSPSKSHTWLQCALSTQLNDGSSSETNPASEFGTQAHELGATLICQSLKINSYDEDEKSIDEVIKELPMYDSNMQSIAEGYANFVISTYDFERKHSDKEPLIVVEQHLDMDFDEDAGGTLDCGILSGSNGGTLTVIDLKTGRIPVSAFNEETKEFNPQLGIYALYFYKAYKDLFNVKNVRLVIYQPVISNTNEYVMPIEELLAFEKNVLIPAVEEANKPNPRGVINAGCKYCAGKAICPIRNQENMKVMENAPKRIELLTDAEIEELLPKLDDFIQYAEDVKEFALKRALHGHKWKCFKLVRAKSNRKITDEEAVAKVCKELGINPYADPKLLGISELTKKLGKDKFNQLVGPYLIKPEGNIVLAKETDPREEVIINEITEEN